MKFENSFAVQAPAEEVWEALLDLERVTPCMPGAEVLERIGEDSFKVGVKVKVGPMRMTYRGQVEIVERDPSTHTAVMSAKAKEARGQGIANATINMSLLDKGSSTEGTIETDVQLSGKAAAMGQGVIQDVSARLVQTFAENLADMLSGAETPAGEATATTAATPETPQPAGAKPSPPPAATPVPPPPPAPPPTPPAPPRAAPATEQSLPVGAIVASVTKERLRDPRIVGGLLVAITVLFAGTRRR